MEIETSIEIVPQGKGFGWLVKVAGKQGGLAISATAKTYLAARFQAGEACRRLAEAALNPVFQGRVLNYRFAPKTNGLRTGKALQAAV